MGKQLYAITSNKRGVLYLGDNGKEKDRILEESMGQEELLNNYFIERKHDSLIIRKISGINLSKSSRAGSVIELMIGSEEIVQALKDFI